MSIDAVERALLLYAGGLHGEEQSFYMEELRRLCEAAGAIVVGEVAQNLPLPDARSYLGRGKLEETAETARASGATMAVAAHPLSGSQQRRIEEALGLRVLDRTQLILDIFAQRARSREGQLQVELAQLGYWLPRLRREAGSLSRLAGGIGTRGPGESKLEMDRRRIRQRMTVLRQRLRDVESHRRITRQERGEMVRIALVGYTNAGKTSLLHALSGSGEAEDVLFATLDPMTRAITLPSRLEALVTDTVGFVQDLPTELVAAFRATLEETREADLLLHVVDASNPRFSQQMAAVADTLSAIGAADIAIRNVYNKVDRLPAAERGHLGGLQISARTGEGMAALLAEVDRVLAERRTRWEFRIPHQRGDLLALVHAHGRVLRERSDAEVTEVEVEMDRIWAGRVAGRLRRG